MNLDINLVIKKLSEQITTLTVNLAMRDAQIEMLQKEAAGLREERDKSEKNTKPKEMESKVKEPKDMEPTQHQTA